MLEEARAIAPPDPPSPITIARVGTFNDMQHSIIKNLKYFENFTRDEIYDDRKAKFLKIGREGGFSKAAILNNSSLRYKEFYLNKVRRVFNKNQYFYTGLLALLLILITFLTVV